MTITKTYTVTTDDLFARSDGQYRDTGTTLKFGRTSGALLQHMWMPFPVNDISQSTTILAARCKIYETAGANNTAKCLYGAASNGSKPANWAAIAAKTFSTGYGTDNAFPANVAGNVTEWDVTASVQAKINAGWVSGEEEIIAIMVKNNVSSTNADRTFASSEHATYGPATLEIDLPDNFTPRIIFS